MRTVHEVSRMTGVSVRTLHNYDEMGLLHPTALSEAGYRLYDDRALERLRTILLYRELAFPLREIRRILDSPAYDARRALEQQIRLLELQREHIEGLLRLAREISIIGGKPVMDFKAFDKSRQAAYAAEAKAAWGSTEAWKECEEKTGQRSDEEETRIGEDFMALFAAFGTLRNTAPDGETAQTQVKALQDYITDHYYRCTDEILRGLGELYAAGGEMTDNIDRVGGEGTAAFVAQAIAARFARG